MYYKAQSEFVVCLCKQAVVDTNTTKSTDRRQYGLAAHTKPKSTESPTTRDLHSRERSRAPTPSQNSQWPSSSSSSPQTWQWTGTNWSQGMVAMSILHQGILRMLMPEGRSFGFVVSGLLSCWICTCTWSLCLVLLSIIMDRRRGT